jgi:hypothetical protein
MPAPFSLAPVRPAAADNVSENNYHNQAELVIDKIGLNADMKDRNSADPISGI